MLEQNVTLRVRFHSWPIYLSLLFLGFFPGALLMYANQQPKQNPVLLEYDLKILRVPTTADLSKVPDFEDWENRAVCEPLSKQGWRILHEPKLMSSYACEVTTYLGPIPGLDGNPGNGPEYGIRFLTHQSGAQLQTYLQFGSSDSFQTHRLLHLPGKTHIQPLSPSRPGSPYRYFLLLKVTPHNQFQTGAPTIPPAGVTAAPRQE